MNNVTVSRSFRRGRAIFGIAEIVARIQLSRRIRRDIRHLDAMSDHELRDIGLRREDIPLAVRHGRNRVFVGR